MSTGMGPMPDWWYMANALTYEWPRVVAWHERHDPETGRKHSWLSAMRATADNSPTFDRIWDTDMESSSPPHDADGTQCWCCPDLVYQDGSHAPGPCRPGEAPEAYGP